MGQVAEQVAGEIQRSLDFYAGTAADANFSKVYLSGGTAKVPALFKTIETRVGVPVEIMNPFKAIEIDNRKFDPGLHHGRGAAWPRWPWGWRCASRATSCG